METVRVAWREVRGVEQLGAAQVREWTHVYRVAWLVRGWPRRLGGDVTDRALATDKHVANKVAHVAACQVGYWGGPKLEWGCLDGEAEWTETERSNAATVNWYEWVPEQVRACLADQEAHRRWAKRQKVSLEGAFTWRWASRQLGLCAAYLVDRADGEGDLSGCVAVLKVMASNEKR